MKIFSEKHPVIFSIIVCIIAFAAVIPFAVAAGLAGFVDLGTEIGRILVGIVLMIIFHRLFSFRRTFDGFVLLLPALLFPLWNIFYHLISDAFQFKSPAELPAAVLAGLAPAVFEEVIFRGIMIGTMKKSGKSRFTALIVSSILFALIHLTNIVGMSPLNVLVQAGYALVVGLLFGAIYIRSGSILVVIIAHALTDISTQIFAENPTETSVPVLIVFGLVLAVAAVCAIVMAARAPKKEKVNE